MMKLNNKGMTLIEIIVSIVLISIVLVFLAILLVDVKDINDKSSTNSTYLIQKALLIKAIETDFIKYNEMKISNCEIKDFYSNYNTTSLESIQKFNECLKFTFNDNTSSYLGVYYLVGHESYVITYVHDNLQRNTYDFKEFEKYNLNGGTIKNNNLKMNIQIGNNTYYYDNLSTVPSSKRAITINVPMIGNDGKDYSIEVSYYGKVSVVK